MQSYAFEVGSTNAYRTFRVALCDIIVTVSGRRRLLHHQEVLAGVQVFASCFCFSRAFRCTQHQGAGRLPSANLAAIQ